VTSLSADGRTGTDGTRTLTVSQAAGLEPGGQQLAVAGSGYDAAKGIYVALCVVPPRNAQPTPCGGGVDIEGQAGAAQWISSNPPDYGVGLARPYGPAGSFSTQFTVRAQIAPGVDCRQVRCAIVTRADHTRTADRSQDIMIPVSFRQTPAPGTPAPPVTPGAPTAPGGGPALGPTATTAPPTVTVPPTAAPAPPPSQAPAAKLSGDGRSVGDGTRTLTVSQARGLDPQGTRVVVRGEGFDERSGVYVALCGADDDPVTPPGPCASGEGRSVWISSTAADHSRHLATAWGAGGSFEATVELAARIDGETDCRSEACAVVVRFDDERSDDRSGDLAIPVRFLDESPDATPNSDAEAATAGSDGGDDEGAGEQAVRAVTDGPASDDASGGGVSPAMVVAAVALPAIGALVMLRWRRGRRRTLGLAS
jgi:hypothetical protein